MKKVCCFGELLLRMSPDANGEWIENACLPVFVGGAELNVANALAAWKIPVGYVSALPDNNMSRSIQQYLTSHGVDASPVHLSGSRIGIYYLTQGKDLKHAGVIYDRSGSSFAGLQPGMLSWSEILKDVDWFHFSAITPALSEQAAAVCMEALQAAAAKNITISVDLNYRSKLWKYNKAPVEIMTPLVDYCDVIMGNIWSAGTLLGIEADASIHNQNSKRAYLDHATRTAVEIRRIFRRCRTVANTFRFDSGSEINYYAALDDSTGQYVSREFTTATAIDKVGSGDCFMAGLIYGLTKQLSQQHTVDFAAAAAFGKLMEHGDSTRNNPDQIISILNSYGK